MEDTKKTTPPVNTADTGTSEGKDAGKTAGNLAELLHQHTF